jgi:hypothetical protein
MNKRPFQIVLLAALQFISPLIYLIFASVHYELSFVSTINEIFALTSGVRLLEIFILPIALGFLILNTKKTGYRFVIAASVYLIVRSLLAFSASNSTDPVFPIVFSNVICILGLIYLIRPRTREIYFNPKLRWWEHDLRYIVNLPATLTRTGDKAFRGTLQNIANGGAGVETTEGELLIDEMVTLEFKHQNIAFKILAKTVWQRTIPEGPKYLGLQWASDADNAERSKVRRLIRTLKESRTPTTRPVTHFWEDMKARISRS